MSGDFDKLSLATTGFAQTAAMPSATVSGPSNPSISSLGYLNSSTKISPFIFEAISRFVVADSCRFGCFSHEKFGCLFHWWFGFASRINPPVNGGQPYQSPYLFPNGFSNSRGIEFSSLWIHEPRAIMPMADRDDCSVYCSWKHVFTSRSEFLANRWCFSYEHSKLLGIREAL